jgi:hypothetical protein
VTTSHNPSLARIRNSRELSTFSSYNFHENIGHQNMLKRKDAEEKNHKAHSHAGAYFYFKDNCK